MASTTAAEIPPQARRALRHYPGVESADIEPLGTGLIHATFAVHAADAEFVLQRVNPVFSPRIHDNMAAVTRHLAEHGLPTLRLLETNDGRLSADLGADGLWRLSTRVPGVTFDTCDSVAQARSAAEVVAHFQSALADLPASLAPLGFPFHETRRHFDALEAALIRHRDHRLAGDVLAIANEIRAAAQSWPDLGLLPRRPIHGDPKFSNVLFEGVTPDTRQRAVTLIDLDTVAELPLYFDMGDAWRSWCNTGGESCEEATLDMAIFRASAEGYLASLEIELGREEQRSIADGIEYVSLELCARFATDALEECYFGWDSQRFPAAGEHNLVRARGQLGLHRQARETREERRRLVLG